MPPSMPPRISVIMNCYNGERFVRQAIQSVYTQTFTDWEIIFWDNASTDRTAEIARSFDSRLRYFRGEVNVPLGQARKLAIAKARGDWLAFVDHDDLCLPRRFELQMATINGGEFAVGYGGVRFIDERGTTISEWLPRYGTVGNFGLQLERFEVNLSTMILNRRVMERFGIALDAEFRTAEDYDLYMRTAAKGPASVVRELLAEYRVWDSLTDRTLGDLARERAITHARLKREDPKLMGHYARQLAEAETRDVYYRARGEMSRRDYGAARSLMASICFRKPLYFVLYLLAFAPPLWRLAHNRVIKTWLSVHVLRT